LTATADPGGNGLIMAGAPIGKTLTLRFDGEPGFGVDVVEHTTVATPTGYNFLYPELAVTDADFELWWYNLTAQNSHWLWGIPTAGPTAFSGEKCWGVGMNGDYPDGAIDLLTSPDNILYGHEKTYLSLHFWCDMEESSDGVSLQIRGANNSWVDITPWVATATTTCRPWRENPAGPATAAAGRARSSTYRNTPICR
jgi:hypothetical protein